MSSKPKWSRECNCWSGGVDRPEIPSDCARNVLAFPDWALAWAACKYAARELHGPRDVTKPLATLAELGAMLADVCECSWRSGFKPAQLQAAEK